MRAYAEAQGIKVEMANEDMPNIWRLRETQRLVAGLRQRKGALLGIQDILDILNEQPLNRWISLLAEGIADLARELNTGAMPVPDIIEWIAEWARDTRGQQRGLLLLTAHRAKGLEFDHVVILNGDWRNPSRNEDPDAPRRLFYVAMTRARQSLTVLTQGMHHLLDVEAPSVLRRKVAVEATHDLPAADIYVLPSLRLVDLSFAGRKHVSQHSLAAIRDAKVGDPLTLEQRDGKWVLIDAGGRLLGRMVNAWQPPTGHAFDKGQVGAIVNWRKVDNKEEFHGTLGRDSWETVLPELIFRPLREETRNRLPVGEPKAREPKTQPVVSNAAVAKSTEGAVSDALQDDLALVETIIRDALFEAPGWEALVVVLEAKGLALAPRGGGLVVMEAKSGVDICKLSAIGIRYLNLIKKFGEGFPGHPAISLVERALSEQSSATAQARPRKGRRNHRTRRGDDDITLVED
jgi:ATP-dependent DNA helicase RecQ